MVKTMFSITQTLLQLKGNIVSFSLFVIVFQMRIDRRHR